MDELIRRLAAVESPTTIAIGVRLLALCDERGVGRMEWPDFLTLTGIQDRGAARRHLTALKAAGVLNYVTDGYVQWVIDALWGARYALPTARDDGETDAPRAPHSAFRAPHSARDAGEHDDALPRARNALWGARFALPTARQPHDLIDDLIYRFAAMAKRQPNQDELRELAEASDIGRKLLTELERRWPSIKSKRNVASYMRSVADTLRMQGDYDEDSSEARRRKYVPDEYRDIIIGA